MSSCDFRNNLELFGEVDCPVEILYIFIYNILRIR